MKKFLLTAGLAVISAITFGQLTYNEWQETIIVDEFGDPTGETVSYALFEGTFSNSATTNSELIVKVIDYGEAILFELYEYGRTPGASMGYSSEWGQISVKRADGNVESYRAFAPDSGGLYFRSKDDFYDMFRSSSEEVVKVIIKESSFSQYGSSVYVFTLITP